MLCCCVTSSPPRQQTLTALTQTEGTNSQPVPGSNERPRSSHVTSKSLLSPDLLCYCGGWCSSNDCVNTGLATGQTTSNRHFYFSQTVLLPSKSRWFKFLQPPSSCKTTLIILSTLKSTKNCFFSTNIHHLEAVAVSKTLNMIEINMELISSL